MQQPQRLSNPMLYVLQLPDMLSLTLWLYRVLFAPSWSVCVIQCVEASELKPPKHSPDEKSIIRAPVMFDDSILYNAQSSIRKKSRSNFVYTYIECLHTLCPATLLQLRYPFFLP